MCLLSIFKKKDIICTCKQDAYYCGTSNHTALIDNNKICFALDNIIKTKSDFSKTWIQLALSVNCEELLILNDSITINLNEEGNSSLENTIRGENVIQLKCGDGKKSIYKKSISYLFYPYNENKI